MILCGLNGLIHYLPMIYQAIYILWLIDLRGEIHPIADLCAANEGTSTTYSFKDTNHTGGEIQAMVN